MRVVTYARVSSLRQETEGQSLQNQERAFTRWLEQTGNHRLVAYRESASAKSIEGRVQFLRMIEELATTKPDAIVVDTLDRFTRNLGDGLRLLEQLRGHHVGLIPLDWRRERPIDIDDDRDWSDVVEEFTAAERERRRIRRRVLRSYEGRRERGATTTSKPPVGLSKVGDRLQPNADAWIVHELDRRFLDGQTQAELHAWYNTVGPRKWRNVLTVRRTLENRSYVEAGLRTPETQALIDARRAEIAARYAKHAEHPQPLTGVFWCGVCYDAGFRNLMSSQHRKGRENDLQLVCWEGRRESAHAGKAFCVHVFRIEPAWRDFIRSLRADLSTWVESVDNGAVRLLERQIARYDQDAAAMKARRDAAFNLLLDGNPAVTAQAKKLLSELEADETALAAQRSMALSALSDMRQTERDPDKLGTALQQYETHYDLAADETKNELNRSLCAAIGSHPRVYRSGGRWAQVRVAWPEVAAGVLSC